MKKIGTILITGILIISALAGCGKTGTGSHAGTAGDAKAQEKRLKIVTTIFPEYDWVRNILRDRVTDTDLTLLCDNGTDLHSYQPTADDILTISTADLFIHVGGESDQWVTDVLKNAINKDMVVLNLLDELGDKVRDEEIVEGMEAEEEEEDADEEEIEYDEHVWLSLQNAMLLCDAITEGLSKIDPDHADLYDRNNTDYREKLSALDSSYRESVEGSAGKPVLFGDRFPFRYLTDDYGLTYYAAFVGCSAETEASFETVIFLADKVDALSLPAILTIEGSDHRLAETIRDNTDTKDQEILSLNSMQSVTAAQIADGADYLSIMTDNLEQLRKALR